MKSAVHLPMKAKPSGESTNSTNFPKPRFWFGDRVRKGRKNSGIIIGMNYHLASDFNPLESQWYYEVKLDEGSEDYELWEGKNTFSEGELKIISASDFQHRKFW